MAPATLLSLLTLVGAVAATASPPVITAAPRALYEDVAGDLVRRQSQPSGGVTTSPLPLTSYHYEYDELPYQINPYPVGRGPQFGFNQCNSTTEGPESNCQTLVMNSLVRRFDKIPCGQKAYRLNRMTSASGVGPSQTASWAISRPERLSTAPRRAGAAVSCLLVPSLVLTYVFFFGIIISAWTATLTARNAQFIRTSAYIQITGRLNQEGVGLDHSDTGGELDPHGQDLLGNPIGGVVYSHGMPTGDNSTLDQIVNWNNFVGSGMFCIKLCDNSIKSPNYCEKSVIFTLLHST